MISNKDIQALRSILLQYQQELQDDRKDGSDATGIVELDQSRVGRLSRMDALQGQAMSQELERRREQELRAISTALARIESGDYGCCETCGDPIALERLRLNPAARLCIRCASEAENP